MAYLISDYYESEKIGQHYRDKRSLAASFLSTMGSKALALTKLTQSVSLNGLDYEAACAHEVIRDQFRIKLCSPVGLLVFKRARNGGLRALQIRLKTCSKVGDHIEWQSKKLFGRRKFFCLNGLKSVNSIDRGGTCKAKEEDESPRTPYVRRSITSLSFCAVDDTTDWPFKIDGQVPFVTLSNETRKLDLKFETLQDTLLCIDLIRYHYISTSTSTVITTEA